MPGALFEFDRVEVVHGGRRVLDGVSAVIPDAGITAVIGASGSGKSTLLRCGNRLERPSAGRVLYRGVDVSTIDPRVLRRRVAMVFQVPTPFPGTGYDNLRAADPTLGVEAAAELARRVGLPPERLDQDATTLSGGEAQRLCVARALATGPETILADEPTSALDPASVEVLEDLAVELAADGVPLVWVTHDRDQMRRIADHVIELDHGRLVFCGPTADHPDHPNDPNDPDHPDHPNDPWSGTEPS